MQQALDPEMVQSLTGAAREVLETTVAMVPQQAEEVPLPVEPAR